MKIMLMMFIIMFMFGCHDNNEEENIVVIEKNPNITSDEEKLKLASDLALDNLLLLRDYRKRFIEDECTSFYKYELNKFYYNKKYESLYPNDFFIHYLVNKEEYLKKMLRDYKPLNPYYTQRRHLENHINRSEIFDNIELLHQEILESCPRKDNIDKIEYKKNGSIVGDHIYVYLDGVMESTYHISKLKSVDGINIKKFKYGHVELKAYTLWIKFFDGENKTFDFISLKKAEQFSIKITTLYDDYMRREQKNIKEDK